MNAIATWICHVKDDGGIEDIKARPDAQAAVLMVDTDAGACRALTSRMLPYVYIPSGAAQPPLPKSAEGNVDAPLVNSAPWVVCAAAIGGSESPMESIRNDEYPIRSVVDAMLKEVSRFAAEAARPPDFDDSPNSSPWRAQTSRIAFARSLVVAVAVNAFGSQNDIIKAKALAPLLKGGLDSAASRRAQTTHLDVQFLQRRQPTLDHVEIRCIEEFDDLVKALFQSRSFMDARSHLSVCINAGIFCETESPVQPVSSSIEFKPMETRVRPTVICAASMWHLWRNHHEAFGSSVKEAALKSDLGAAGVISPSYAFNPLGGPQYFVGGLAVIAGEEARQEVRYFITKFDLVLSALRGRLARPPPRVEGGVEPTAARSARLDLYEPPVDLHEGDDTFASDVPSALTVLQSQKLQLMQSIADANSELYRLSNAMDNLERLELAHLESEGLATELDEAETTFELLAHRVRLEKDERERVERVCSDEMARHAKIEAESRRADSEVHRARAALQHVEDLKSRQREQLAAAETRLIRAQEAADRAKDAAAKLADRARTHTDDEFTRLMEARTVAIEEANATIVRQQSSADDAVTSLRDRTVASERLLRDRISELATQRREAASRLLEVQSKLASRLEAARNDERRLLLANAQLEQTKRRHGEKASVESLRGLQITEATLAAEIDKLMQAKGSLELHLSTSAAADQEVSAAAMAKDAELIGAVAAAKAQRDEIVNTSIYVLLETESLRREALEDEEAARLNEVRFNERINWRYALEGTQAVLHEQGHSHARIEVAATGARVATMNERIMAHRSRLDTVEKRMARAAEEHEMIIGEYHKHHEAVLVEEQTLEAARETAFEAEVHMRKLDAQAAAFRKKCDLVRQALSRAPVDPLASVRPVVLPPMPEVMKRLRRLLRDATQRINDANAESNNCERTVRRIGREVDERAEIRQRVRHAISQYEARVEELEHAKMKATNGVASRANRDKSLREQLRAEYEAAQELTQRHKFEAQQRLREAFAAVDELTALVQKSTSEVQALQTQLTLEKKRNTPSNEELLRMELFHEIERQKSLEQTALASVARQGVVEPLHAPSLYRVSTPPPPPSGHTYGSRSAGTPSRADSVASGLQYSVSAVSNTQHDFHSVASAAAPDDDWRQ